MSCPKCHGAMRTYERNGVHLDQCTECRGLFLDRGELERLIEAESAYYDDRPSAPPSAPVGPGAPTAPQQPSYQQPTYQQPAHQQPGYGAAAQAASSSGSASSSDLGRLAGEVLRQVSSSRSTSHVSSGYGKRKKSFLEQLLG